MVVLGFAAAALTTGCWIPQLVRSVRSRSVKDFSWTYLLSFTLGIALWFCYGVARRDVVIITANAVSIFFLFGLIGLKSASRRREQQYFVEVVETVSELG